MYIYIWYMVFTTKRFFEVAIESGCMKMTNVPPV